MTATAEYIDRFIPIRHLCGHMNNLDTQTHTGQLALQNPKHFERTICHQCMMSIEDIDEWGADNLAETIRQKHRRLLAIKVKEESPFPEIFNWAVQVTNPENGFSVIIKRPFDWYEHKNNPQMGLLPPPKNIKEGFLEKQVFIRHLCGHTTKEHLIAETEKRIIEAHLKQLQTLCKRCMHKKEGMTKKEANHLAKTLETWFVGLVTELQPPKDTTKTWTVHVKNGQLNTETLLSCPHDWKTFGHKECFPAGIKGSNKDGL